MYQPVMKARMEELERRKAEIAERMAQAPADVPDVNPILPTSIASRSGSSPRRSTIRMAGREAAEAIRSLIGDVVLKPGPKRGQVDAELRGELMGILDFTGSGQHQGGSEVRTNAVARPRNQTSL